MKSSSICSTLLSIFIAVYSTVVTQKHVHASRSQLFCYYSSYAQNRPDVGKFVPENIDPNLCTHVIFTFADVIQGTNLKASGWNDLENGKDSGLYERTVSLKKSNPRLKVLLAVGGWRAGSEPFVAIVDSASTRRTFANNAAKFVRQHGFDGLDVDWEFPGSRGSGPEHKALFTQLLKDLREAFELEARDSGRERLLLTMAAAGGSYYIELAYETRHIVRYVDYLLVMAYNYHGSWNKFTGHHSGLFARSDEVAGEREWNQAWTIDYWLNKARAPKEKVIVGISTYGTTFTLANAAQHGLKAASTGPGKAGKYTQEAGTLAYYEVCDNLRNGWTSVWINEQKAPYAYRGDQWVGYDNVDSVTYKAQYLLKQGVAGAFIWSLEMDDFRGSCGNGKYPLLSAIASVLGVQSSTGRSSFNDFDTEFFPSHESSRRRGSGESSDGGRRQEVDGRAWRERGDRERGGRTSSRRRPFYRDDDVDDDYAGSSELDSARNERPTHGGRTTHADSAAGSPPRHHHGLQPRPRQQHHFDDDHLAPAKRRPTATFSDDLSSSETFRRRYDDIDDDRRRQPERRRHDDTLADQLPTARRRDLPAAESAVNERRGSFAGRRRTSQDTAADRRQQLPDVVWNDHDDRATSSSSSSSSFDEDLFAANARRADTPVDDRGNYESRRMHDFGDLPVDENGSCKRSGVFLQPGTDCKSYYVCVQQGSSWHQFFMSCPRGKKFNTAIAACETPSSAGHSCTN